MISPERFEGNVRYIRAREQSLIGQAVVCRSNKTGAYYLGSVRDRVSGCRNYLVEWADRSLDVQVISLHIFRGIWLVRLGDAIILICRHILLLETFPLKDNQKPRMPCALVAAW